MAEINLDLNGFTAIVTGASRGIGARIALDLARNGASVAACARTSPQIASTESESPEKAPLTDLVHPYQLDIKDESNINTVFDQITAELGPPDILVNNAGIGHFGPTIDFPVEQLDEILTVNVRGTFLCCRKALARMQTQGSGTIINVSSVVGFKGYPQQAAYTASKHAVLGLTKSLANEFHGTGIRVSAVLPGGVDTGMVSDSRPDLDRSKLMRPEDVSGTVMYLLSLSDRAMVDQIYIRRSASAPF